MVIFHGYVTNNQMVMDNSDNSPFMDQCPIKPLISRGFPQRPAMDLIRP